MHELDKVNDSTLKLEKRFNDLTFDVNTKNALVYFIANSNKLKYLLLANPIKDRQIVILNHLEDEFGDINRYMIIPTLNRHLIFSGETFVKIVVSIFLLMFFVVNVLLHTFIIIGVILHIIFLLLAAVIAIIVISELKQLQFSYIRLYPLSREYRRMPKLPPVEG